MTGLKGEGVLKAILGEDFHRKGIKQDLPPGSIVERKLAKVAAMALAGTFVAMVGKEAADHIQKVPELKVVKSADDDSEKIRDKDAEEQLASAKAADADIFPPDGGVGK